MLRHTDLEARDIQRMIRSGEIQFAGNRSLKIFGKLDCASGRRMNRTNRVFFESAHAAIDIGYRPCGHCMKADYISWRSR